MNSVNNHYSRRPGATVLALIIVLAGGIALAHARLVVSQPEAGAVLATAPAEIVLEFSEAVETAFSVFAVHRLDAEVDLEAEGAADLLVELAGVVADEVLAEGYAGESLHLSVAPAAGAAETVVLGLAADLPAGHYVVAWRVLSVDTHVLNGFLVFSVTE